MSNRIIDVRIEDRSLDPASPELSVEVRPECLDAQTEVRGRMMGPSSPYASTVEVAYPFIPSRRDSPPSPGSLGFRVVVPEASLWSPEGPYLYTAIIELWQDGQRCDRTQVHHGLRQIALGPRGLRVNGRLLTIAGQAVEALTPEQAQALRQQKRNTLLVPLRAETAAIWDTADRLGFFVLGRIEREDGETVRLLQTLSRHPSCLGWLAKSEEWADGDLDRLAEVIAKAGGPSFGMEVRPGVTAPLPNRVRFVASRENRAAGPTLVLRATGPDGVELGGVDGPLPAEG